MRRYILTPILGFLVFAGCASFPVTHVETGPIPQQDHIVLKDQRISPPETGSLNGFSCHYAIKKIDEASIDPPRLTLLGAFLANHVYIDNVAHQVTVSRFDIYWNFQRLAKSSPSVAGPLGVAVETLLSYKPYVFNGDVLIGCKDAEEGEYFLSEFPDDGATPIIIYLNVNIDGKDYKIRSLYKFIRDDGKWPDVIQAAITADINNAFAALGDQIKSAP